ncbi:MAG: nucleotidyltransferase domain-containing protein [Bacillota bacterium]|nr:nucleotidyltransferase domain-containing protein [Bacillota bacterium]
MRRLEGWAAALVKDKGALAVILFGSLARGDQTAASDADVVVILAESSLPFRERIPPLLPSGLGVGVDLFPYTLEEARAAWRDGSGVLPVALKEGLFLAGDRESFLLALQTSV